MTENDFRIKLEEIGISINDNQLEQLNEYHKLLVEWNKKINLTGIVEKDEVFLKHFYDSLTMNKIVDLKSIHSLCDVGTGAGFPGLVIKILFPNIKVTLIDALNKRIIFLNDVIKKLNLHNIETVHSRSEDYAIKNREMYEIVTARAVASLPVLMEICVPLVKENYFFIPLKANIDDELKISFNACKELNIKEENKIEFLLPYEYSKRTLVKYKKFSKTDKKYPRRFSEIKKKPL